MAPVIDEEQRALWQFIQFALDPASDETTFVAELGEARVLRLIEYDVNEQLLDSLTAERDGAHMRCKSLTIRLIGPMTAPFDEDADDRSSWFEGRSWRVRSAIGALSKSPRAEAGLLLAAFAEDPGLERWRNDLRHAQAQQLRIRRDSEFRHPSPAAVLAAIAGGPPVSAADLLAVVTEELYRLRRELRTGENNPWKRYWNLQSTGAPDTPRIENECRDHLLDRLRDRLGRYGIAASLPEARHGEETRADALILSYGPGRLPIEAKRHYHPDVWTAAATQLQGYAASEGAEGFGIYLVFWFGTAVSPLPPRLDGAPRPASADELEARLRADLPSVMRVRTEVVVFDVADPAATTDPRRRRPRATKLRRRPAPTQAG